MHLHPLDLAIVAVYLLGITLFGLRFAKRGKASDRSLKGYFLASNTIPWWAIALSIVSAETSTLTIISVPGVAFTGDLGFLQIVFGYMLGRIVVAALFLPRYFAGEMLTAYQLIGRRFGPGLHRVTAGLFLLTRAAAEGVRVFAVSIVVGIAIGTGDRLSIAIISLLTLLYTFEGGMAAVIWTDVVQMAIYLAGTLVAVWSLGRHIPGGWTAIHHVAAAAGKFHLFNFALNLTTTYTFWAGIFGGTFLTMASHGTDQLMVQRLLAARSLRQSRLALLSSGVVVFIQFTLFLLIGVGLYVFYSGRLADGLTPDRLFPTFIVRELPIGVAGLLVAAILAAAMSNLSAALNSLSSTTVVDFYMRLRPNADDRERNLISRSSTVLWALVLFAIAIYSLSVGGHGHVVEIGLSIASVAYGCLLGVFLLGTLTRFATETGAAIGMVCGFLVNLAIWQLPTANVVFHPGTPQARTLAMPHIAYTWYVLIGALVTFSIGALCSLVFSKQSRRRAPTAAMLLPFFFLLSFPKGICVSTATAQTPAAPVPAPAAVISAGAQRSGETPALAPATTPDFSPIATLLNDAIAAHKLPGAVVLIGHDNHVVFEHAYGDRKLAGEPGLDGAPGPAEPMTDDTLFDMASLSKDLSTAVAIMQLYEQGKIASFDDPLDKYLPAFNPQHDPARARVTLRMLLTHTSGAAPDVSLKAPWGLAAPDKAEGIRLALTTPLVAAPGSVFTYSDINFILLGCLVERLSGQPLDVYAQDHIFRPLGMTDTRYLPIDKACGPHKILGAAIIWAPPPRYPERFACPPADWSTSLLPRIAPTTHDDEGTRDTNPHFDMLTRGTVHDPTTRRMGGVAGHAGVFSTAHDVSLYASALLEKLLYDTGPFPLKQSTLLLMTQPQQPTASGAQHPDPALTPRAPHLASEMWASTALSAANQAEAASIAAGDKPSVPGLAPHYPAIPGQSLRGYGWDIDTAFSKPRGLIFPIGSFGHTGFTGTSLWMDPASDTYVILLANAIHPRGGNGPISNLRGQVATAAARALGLDCTAHTICDATVTADPSHLATTPSTSTANLHSSASGYPEPSGSGLISPPKKEGLRPPGYALPDTGKTLTGIDVLEATHFAALAPYHRLGLLTNQTGLDAQGRRTLDILYSLPTTHHSLLTVFSPEHGLTGALDTAKIASSADPATHLPVISLYGSKDSDRRPTHAQLANLDAVVIDLQDAGVRYWTYEAATGYFLEAAATEHDQYHHDLQIILLDRPDPIAGLATQGPTSDPNLASYVDYLPIPSRHGLTLGELARYIVATKHLSTRLTVVPMQHWQRAEYFADTGLPWTAPSPNLRTPAAAILYPCLGLIETTNISVGRGTPHPFSFFGAPFMDAPTVAAALTARHIPGVTFTAATEPIADDANHYPFHAQTIPAVRLAVTDPAAFDSPECAIEILSVLHKLCPTQFRLDRAMTLVASRSTIDAVARGDDPRAIAESWRPAIAAFRTAVDPYLLYR